MFHHVPLSVPCQHRLVRRAGGAGESITHMLLQRHHKTASLFSSLVATCVTLNYNYLYRLTLHSQKQNQH